MTFAFAKKILPSWQNALLAVLAAVLLILAFPNFELWFTAWFALVPLMWAVEREKLSTARSFILGWLFGTIFFFGTCWWLTFAPITYAAFPPWLAYGLMLIVAVMVGVFPAIFAGVLAILLRRFGSRAFLAAPFVWVFTEFLRYWLTGNNWNAIGYSQACEPSCAFPAFWFVPSLWTAAIGGVLFTTGIIAFANVMIVRSFCILFARDEIVWKLKRIFAEWVALFVLSVTLSFAHVYSMYESDREKVWQTVIAVQPNVPMSDLDADKWQKLRQRQIDLAEREIRKVLEQRKEDSEWRLAKGVEQSKNNEASITVVLPESPMNFMYSDDREFQQFIGDFARRNNVSVLFNSAEPDKGTTKYFNSAVMVGPDGKKVAEYDKIYLLPFGEAVPPFLEGIVPGFVGNFAYGREYDILPVGDAKAGVMICFESHFGQLSRRYVQDGADMLIEMTNDGYLGPTPVLRQHLANSIFRAVETNRPVLRVTNVGVTARIAQDGDICDSLAKCGLDPYTEGTSIWSVSKSDGSQTFYVRFGDWFAWLCSTVTIGLLILGIRRKKSPTATNIKAWGVMSIANETLRKHRI